MTENEMVGWHHRPNGREFGESLRVGDGQGGLVCFNPWGRKESDATSDCTDPQLRFQIAQDLVQKKKIFPSDSEKL